MKRIFQCLGQPGSFQKHTISSAQSGASLIAEDARSIKHILIGRYLRGKGREIPSHESWLNGQNPALQRNVFGVPAKERKHDKEGDTDINNRKEACLYRERPGVRT